LLIKYGNPCSAEIIGFPNSAVIDSDIEHVRLGGNTYCANGSAPAVRTDHPPFKGLEDRGVVSLGRCELDEGKEQNKNEY
jgi:hypothetical protein